MLVKEPHTGFYPFMSYVPADNAEVADMQESIEQFQRAVAIQADKPMEFQVFAKNSIKATNNNETQFRFSNTESKSLSGLPGQDASSLLASTYQQANITKEQQYQKDMELLRKELNHEAQVREFEREKKSWEEDKKLTIQELREKEIKFEDHGQKVQLGISKWIEPYLGKLLSTGPVASLAGTEDQPSIEDQLTEEIATTINEKLVEKELRKFKELLPVFINQVQKRTNEQISEETSVTGSNDSD